MQPTALVRRGQLPATVPAGAPAPRNQNAMHALLGASVQAYGDVVSALLFDLDRTSRDMDGLAWLGTTPCLLENEAAYHAAVQQLAWWDEFLRTLPVPHLHSESRRVEHARIRAERAGVRLRARQSALIEHRKRVSEALANPDLADEERERLARVHDAPDETEWWVDPVEFADAALRALPPIAATAPITPEDIDVSTSFSGFNAIEAMRTHPALGPRAKMMDEAIARLLSTETGLSRADARTHATRLTDIFWIALRRALSAGNRQLATSVTLLLAARENRIQDQFARELLESWFAYLSALPPPVARKSLVDRIPLLGKLLGASQPPKSAAPKLIESGPDGGPRSRR